MTRFQGPQRVWMKAANLLAVPLVERFEWTNIFLEWIGRLGEASLPFMDKWTGRLGAACLPFMAYAL